MDAELKKIMDLVASGTITKEQGDILINAINKENSQKSFDNERQENKDTVINLGDKIGKTVTNALNKTSVLLSELNIDQKISQAIDNSIREIKKGKGKIVFNVCDDDDDDDDDEQEHQDMDITFNDGITEKKKFVKPSNSLPYEDREVFIKFVSSNRVIKRNYTVSQFLAEPENLDKAVNMALSFSVLDLINERFTGEYKYINNDIVLKVKIF